MPVLANPTVAEFRAYLGREAARFTEDDLSRCLGDAIVKFSEAEAAGCAVETFAEHEFSSTQFNLPEDLAEQIRAFAAQIPDEDLDEKGREDNPHLTCLYGLHAGSPDLVESKVADFGVVPVQLGKMTLFAAKEDCGDRCYDVLKIDVVSPKLRRLNKLLSELPHTDTHPSFNPHITVAYLKPAWGADYDGSTRFAGTIVEFPTLIFSDRDRDETPIPLTTVGIEKFAAKWRQEQDAKGQKWVSEGGAVRRKKPPEVKEAPKKQRPAAKPETAPPPKPGGMPAGQVELKDMVELWNQPISKEAVEQIKEFAKNLSPAQQRAAIQAIGLIPSGQNSDLAEIAQRRLDTYENTIVRTRDPRKETPEQAIERARKERGLPAKPTEKDITKQTHNPAVGQDELKKSKGEQPREKETGATANPKPAEQKRLPKLDDAVNQLMPVLSRGGKFTKKTLEDALPDIAPEALKHLMNDLYRRGHVSVNRKPEGDEFRLSRRGLKDVITGALQRMGLTNKESPSEEEAGAASRQKQETAQAAAAREKRKFSPDVNSIQPKAIQTRGLLKEMNAGRRYGASGTFFTMAQKYGLATNGKFMIVLPEKEHAKIKKEPNTGETNDKVVEAIHKQSTEMLKGDSDPAPAKIVGARQIDFETTRRGGKHHIVPGTPTYLLQAGNKNAAVNASYYKTIMERYPNATVHLPPGRKPGSKPLHFKVGGKTVAILMPLSSDDEHEVREHGERAQDLFSGFSRGKIK